MNVRVHPWRASLVACSLALTVATIEVRAAAAALCGDMDGNGTVAVNDVVRHLLIVNGGADASCGGAGYAGCGNLNGDATHDPEINDTVLLLNRASGIANCQPDFCASKEVLAGCPGPVDLPSHIGGAHASIVVPAGCDAHINGLVFVEAGAALTIEKGAVVKGNTWYPASMLVVKPGGRLYARGTPTQPVTFTSAAAPGARESYDWSGVALLGRAPVNQPGLLLEGLPVDPSLVYGGTDPNDFSGCLQYTRIEFAGLEFSADVGGAALQLAGVGRKTVVHHVEVHRTFYTNTGILLLGGTVNVDHVVASACGDDGFDVRYGFSGGVQFGLVMQEAESVTGYGNAGIRSTNSPFDFNATPVTDPKFCNLTLLGARYSGANPGATNQPGILSLGGSAMTVANAIVKDFRQAGYHLRFPETAARACTPGHAGLNTVVPVGEIVNSLFANNGPDGTVHAYEPVCSGVSCDFECPSGGTCNCSAAEHLALLAAKNTIGTTDADVAAIGGGTFPRTNLVPPAGSLAATHPHANCAAINASFVDAPYIGAFEPGGADWTAGWTEYPVN
jgi:hypothetical protein